MELEILWTNSAITQLELIFDYNKTTVGITVARKLTKGIVQKTASLANQPRKGPREELLINRLKE